MVSFFEGERRERKRERGRENQSRDHHHGDVIINNVGHTRRQHSTDSPRKRSRFSAEMASDSTSNTLDALDALSIAPVSPFLLPFSLPLPLLSSLTLSLSLSLCLSFVRSFFLSFFATPPAPPIYRQPDVDSYPHHYSKGAPFMELMANTGSQSKIREKK